VSLNDIATVNVSTTSAGVTRAGYGVPLILSHSAQWVERFRVYASITAVAADFAFNSPEYMAANKIFSAAIKVTQIMIGRAANVPTQKFSIGVQATALNTPYRLRVAGATGVVWVSQDATYNSGMGATVWSPSNTWARGDLIANPPATSITNIYSCLGPSNAGGTNIGFTGIGAASGPTGTSAAFREGGVYWMYVGTGNTGSITQDAVIAGVKARVDALSAPAFSGTGTGQFSTSFQGAQGAQTLQILANTAGSFFAAQIYDRNVLNGSQTHADPGIVTDLTAVKKASNAWYGLVTLFNSELLVDAAAAWVETNTKLYGPSVQDTTIPTVAASIATDAAHDFKAAAYARSWVFAHPSADEFAGAGEMGRFFPVSPGGETWRMKTLPGVTEEAYSDTEVQNMKDKYAHFYYDMGGVPVVGGDAKSGAGEYIDTVRFLDWYTSELQAKLADLVISSDKVPFTNPGIDLIEAKVTAQNKAGIAAGGIAANPKPVVTAPDVSDIDSADKAARELAGVVTTFTLAGAIHHITPSVFASV
jgi:hypothetical protein